MNNRMLMEAVAEWLDEANIPYSRTKEHFVFVLDAHGRGGFFESSIDVVEGTLQICHIFPAHAHEDELPDTEFAMEAINGAMAAGKVHWIRVLSAVAWSVAVRIGDCGAKETIERLISYGRRVVETYTEYLAVVLMNGRENAPALPEMENMTPDGMELLPFEVILERLKKALEEEEEESEEYGEWPEPFVQRRGSEKQEDCDPAYRSFCRYLDTFSRTYFGNGKNRLIWHYSLSDGRMDRVRLEMQSDAESYLLTASLPIRVNDEEAERVKRLMDSINGRLEYGMMRCVLRSGMICYRIRIREQNDTPIKRMGVAATGIGMLSECSDAILRAMFDHNIGHEVLVGLCREGVEMMNEHCRAEGIKEMAL